MTSRSKTLDNLALEKKDQKIMEQLTALPNQESTKGTSTDDNTTALLCKGMGIFCFANK